MGPPIYIGGNALRGCPRSAAVESFNGATDLHRWKRHTVARHQHRAPRFNGATDLHRWKHQSCRFGFFHGIGLQWGHRFTSVETKHGEVVFGETRAGFNGATDLHRWKR